MVTTQIRIKVRLLLATLNLTVYYFTKRNLRSLSRVFWVLVVEADDWLFYDALQVQEFGVAGALFCAAAEAENTLISIFIGQNRCQNKFIVIHAEAGGAGVTGLAAGD